MRFWQRKNNRNIGHVGFFSSFEMQATYSVSSGRLEIFPRYWAQPATPQIPFFWENIKRQVRVSFTVRKTAWNTTSEPASTTNLHFVLFLATNTSMQCARDVIMQMCYFVAFTCVLTGYVLSTRMIRNRMCPELRILVNFLLDWRRNN